MRIRVFSRNEALVAAQNDMSYKIIISIYTPGDTAPEFPNNPTILDVLSLSFYDIENKKEMLIPVADDEIFNTNYAKQIKDFVTFWRKNENPKLEEIWVHCDAGVSRSAGVAAALLKALFNDDSEIYDNPRYFPNFLCYKTLLEAFHNNN